MQTDRSVAKPALRLGLLSLAHVHAPSYAACLASLPAQEARLVGIWDDQAQRGQAGAQQYHAEYFSDLDQLLQQVDAVVIASTNRQHEELVLAAIQHKVAVLCEKPLSIDQTSAARMVQAARQAGVPLFTAFPVRFMPAVERAREIIRSGRIGRVLAINGTNHGQMPGGWFTDPKESGGGSLIDHTVHVADLIRWFLGREFTQVYAEYDRRLYDIPTEDCALLTMEIEGGVFATLDSSWSRPRSFPFWGDVTMQIQGTAGVVRLNAFDETMTFYNDQQMRSEWVYTGSNADLRMIQEFVRVVRDGGPTQLATGEDGLRAAEVAFFAYEAGRRHRPVAIARVEV
ncbi:MAG: Gfo/Idh/MocA family oxidoreductase [Limnochordaceae bacterium]|nr:Gfo/Idh/MocA family oxidoreductase [Limnochordaceae bacterium]